MDRSIVEALAGDRGQAPSQSFDGAEQVGWVWGVAASEAGLVKLSRKQGRVVCTTSARCTSWGAFEANVGGTTPLGHGEGVAGVEPEVRTSYLYGADDKDHAAKPGVVLVYR